jgi:hypothetical protein
MDLTGAFQRTYITLGETNGSDFTCLDQVCHRTNAVLNRHVRIDAMQMIKMDHLDS